MVITTEANLIDLPSVEWMANHLPQKRQPKGISQNRERNLKGAESFQNITPLLVSPQCTRLPLDWRMNMR
jgi:hypothetical protein